MFGVLAPPLAVWARGGGSLAVLVVVEGASGAGCQRCREAAGSTVLGEPPVRGLRHSVSQAWANAPFG
jgi:hypothetical protein